MDVAGLARERIAAAISVYAESADYAKRAVSDRLAAVRGPGDRFAQLLGETMQTASETISYTKATPENLAAMRAVTTERTTQYAQRTQSAVSADWPESLQQKREQYDPLVEQAAQKYGLSSDLIHAVIRAESSYNPNDISSAGAQGLMQLMPGTAKLVGVTNSFDPAQNIDGGANYLRQMLDRFDGDLRLALAAYNCGPGRVESLGVTSSGDAQEYTRLSDGVRTYVSRVLSYAGIA